MVRAVVDRGLELLKLDTAIGQTSVAKYMAKRRGPPSQGWKTFLRNHADGIAAIDLFQILCRPILGGVHHQYVRI